MLPSRNEGLNRLHAVDAYWRHMASPHHILAIYSGDSLWRMPEAGGWVGGWRAGGGWEEHKWRQEWSRSSERRCNEVSLAFSMPKLSESV